MEIVEKKGLRYILDKIKGIYGNKEELKRKDTYNRLVAGQSPNVVWEDIYGKIHINYNANLSDSAVMTEMLNIAKKVIAGRIGNVTNWERFWGLFELLRPVTEFYPLLTLPPTITDLSKTFAYCQVKDIDLSYLNTKNVTKMESTFRLSIIEDYSSIENWDTSNVTSMLNMFYGVRSRGALDLTRWDVSSVTNFDRVFQLASQLARIDISTWDVSYCTTFICLFSGCNTLTEIDIRDWKIQEEAVLSNMFERCTNLTKIGLPSIPVGATTTQMFLYDSKLTTIEMNDDALISASLSFKFSVGYTPSPLTRESCLVLFNHLDPDNPGTITLGSYSLSLLSADDIAIATNKGWTVE